MQSVEPVQPVKVIDPVANEIYDADLERLEHGFHLRRVSERPSSDNSMYISPGWIDMHAHVYDGMTSLSVPPDSVGLQTGVHLLADAGSAGEATLAGLRDYVIPRYQTRVRAWLNISSIGLVHLREVADLSLIDVVKTVECAVNNMPLVCGIKVRSSGAIVGQMGLQPLQLAILAARELSLPVMVHIGEAPPLIDDVLNLLDNGDVITHCFHGKVGRPWTLENLPHESLIRAFERGVKMDVGHGAASFSWDVAKGAIQGGYLPYSISTDVHIRNINGPVFNLPTTMTKLLHCGMPLLEVIRAVTTNPAATLRESDFSRLQENPQNATLFQLGSTRSTPSCSYRDARGLEQVPDYEIKPVSIIVNGVMKSLHAVVG